MLCYQCSKFRLPVSNAQHRERRPSLLLICDVTVGRWGCETEGLYQLNPGLVADLQFVSLGTSNTFTLKQLAMLDRHLDCMII